MGLSSSIEKPAVSMSEDSVNFVKEKIKTNNVMIFSKSYCPYCHMAKKAFEELGVHYEVLEVDRHPDGEEIQDILAQMTGARSVPRVFVGGKCIGGGTETKSLQKSGELKRLLDQCG